MNQLNSVTLMAKPGNWQLFMARKMDAKFSALEQKILQRDRYTCQFCGFQAKEYQEIVNLNQDYTDNITANLVTACCFCRQCFFLESIGLDSPAGGTIIYLPEMTQTELNALCHVLFCTMANGTDYKTSAQVIYRSLKQRSYVVEEKLGKSMSDPVILGQILVDFYMEGCEKYDKVLGGLRLLPSHTKFKTQIASWAQTALSELSPKKN